MGKSTAAQISRKCFSTSALRTPISGRPIVQAWPELVVANGLYPSLPRTLGKDPGTQLWKARRRMNERELGRLASGWDGPLLELPLLPLDRGPGLIQALAARLVEGDR